MSALVVSVHGAEGRMGRLVTELVEATDGFTLGALLTEVGRGRDVGDFHPSLPLTPQDRFADVVPEGSVVVDFSLAPALEGLLAGAKDVGAGLVIGTTGYSDDQEDALRRHAESLPVVHATNFSVGVPLMAMLLERLADVLPDGFGAEQVETHHRHKVDRPSGTARTLSTAWTNRRGGEAPPTHSLRIGGITGEHRWTFADDEETIEVVHRAQSRRAFLRGVVPAVRFVAGQESGLYGMGDVLAAAAAAR